MVAPQSQAMAEDAFYPFSSISRGQHFSRTGGGLRWLYGSAADCCRTCREMDTRDVAMTAKWSGHCRHINTRLHPTVAV